MPDVNRREFAEFIGYSPRQVGDWLDQGMPCSRSGKKGEAVLIDSAAAVKWLLNRDQDESSTARLKRAQAERAERENNEAMGSLISITEHTELLCDLASEFVRSISGQPGRLAGELAAITDPALIRARLLDELGSVRNTLAKRCGDAAERVIETRDAVAEAETDSQPAAEDLAGSVG